jgi:hypothetical protein
MSFIQTVSEDSATGLAADLLDQDRAALGYVPNYAKLFTLRPEIDEAWRTLNGALRADRGGDLRGRPGGRCPLLLFKDARRHRHRSRRGVPGARTRGAPLEARD